MRVLVLNAGSSSIKAAYFVDNAVAWSAEKRWDDLDSAPHGRAAAEVIDAAICTQSIAPQAVGHRVVHGVDIAEPAIVNAEVRKAIEAAAEFAPLHNGAALAGIDAARARFPDVPQVAVFDTSFHRTMPDEARLYAIPAKWAIDAGLRKYGFHGISHRANAERAAQLAHRPLAETRIVSAHLGSGASLCAVAGGKSIETTMGFTTMDGLVMSSRSGSVDPGLILYLLRAGYSDAADLERTLNQESGLLGLSGVSGDMRELLAAQAAGNARVRLTLDVFVHRLAASIAAMAAALRGIDILSFTGGIGEHAADIRARTCERLAFLGIELDPNTNAATHGDGAIGAASSRVFVSVVTAREEAAIAREVEHLLAPAPMG